MRQTAQNVVEAYREKTTQETVEEKIVAIDAQAKRSASVPAIVVGIIGALMLGGGMSITMELQRFFIIGIALGVIGLALAGIAYPLYQRRLATAREAAKPEIMRLAEQLD